MNCGDSQYYAIQLVYLHLDMAGYVFSLTQDKFEGFHNMQGSKCCVYERHITFVFFSAPVHCIKGL
jgi:hypothetical protein